VCLAEKRSAPPSLTLSQAPLLLRSGPCSAALHTGPLRAESLGPEARSPAPPGGKRFSAAPKRYSLPQATPPPGRALRRFALGPLPPAWSVPPLRSRHYRSVGLWLLALLPWRSGPGPQSRGFLGARLRSGVLGGKAVSQASDARLRAFALRRLTWIGHAAPWLWGGKGASRFQDC
jgi:hypothetical protein